MDKRYCALLLILASVFVLFAACQNEVACETRMEDRFTNEFEVNNTTMLEDVLTQTYDLQELQAFFGEIPTNEALMYGSGDRTEDFSMRAVNERFPVECLRLGGAIGYYSVYRVASGGYFYVFWTKTSEASSGEPAILEGDCANAYFTVYLPSLRKESDFAPILEGASTAEDVSEIDPALEVSFLMSSGIYSYSLLEDGSVLEIRYENCSHIESRSDLIVDGKSILTKETAAYSSYLAAIRSEDLPTPTLPT